jgi:hypothetical protein
LQSAPHENSGWAVEYALTSRTLPDFNLDLTNGVPPNG